MGQSHGLPGHSGKFTGTSDLRGQHTLSAVGLVGRKQLPAGTAWVFPRDGDFKHRVNTGISTLLVQSNCLDSLTPNFPTSWATQDLQLRSSSEGDILTH